MGVARNKKFTNFFEFFSRSARPMLGESESLTLVFLLEIRFSLETQLCEGAEAAERWKCVREEQGQQAQREALKTEPKHGLKIKLALARGGNVCARCCMYVYVRHRISCRCCCTARRATECEAAAQSGIPRGHEHPSDDVGETWLRTMFLSNCRPFRSC